jgi:hypothetical protein
MPTLPELRRSPRRHSEAKKTLSPRRIHPHGTHDDISASSQSMLSDAKTACTSTTPAVPGTPSEVTSITQSQSVDIGVGAARDFVWHTLSEKVKERERMKAWARVDARIKLYRKSWHLQLIFKWLSELQQSKR